MLVRQLARRYLQSNRIENLIKNLFLRKQLIEKPMAALGLWKTLGPFTQVCTLRLVETESCNDNRRSAAQGTPHNFVPDLRHLLPTIRTRKADIKSDYNPKPNVLTR